MQGCYLSSNMLAKIGIKIIILVGYFSDYLEKDRKISPVFQQQIVQL